MPERSARRVPEAGDLLVHVGRRIRAIRKARGLGEAEIEARFFNFKYLQRIEAGQVNLTLRTLERLARILETDLRAILMDEVSR